MYFAHLTKAGEKHYCLEPADGGKASQRFIDRKAYLIARLRRALQTTAGHPRADKFLRKLSGQINELVTLSG